MPMLWVTIRVLKYGMELSCPTQRRLMLASLSNTLMMAHYSGVKIPVEKSASSVVIVEFISIM